MVKQKVLLDSDPGIDDALAIVFALKHEAIDLLGICAVAGNTSLDNSYKNAVNILRLCEREDIPVLRGSSKALEKQHHGAIDAHGENGLDGYQFETNPEVPSFENAVDYMIETVKRYPQEVIIAAIGPLTNIAKAIQKEPNFSKLAKAIVIMGGAAFVPGNVTADAEFNFYSDPLAADIVMKSGANISLIPLDITHKTRLTRKVLRKILTTKNNVTKFLDSILNHRFEVLEANHQVGYAMHDPLAIGAIIDPNIIYYDDYDIEIETTSKREGKCIIHPASDKNKIHIGKGVDHERFIRLYQDTLMQS